MAAVAKERLKSPRARLFVALDLPDEAREGVVAWGRKALADPALRPVRPESLHITLVFLGYRPEKEIERIAATVQESAAPAPWIELLEPVQRPPRGKARLYALPVLSPGTESLQAGLEQKLVEGGFYEPEKRPFWPHVTLARAKRGKSPRRLEPPELPPELRTPFEAGEVTLYRSTLRPQGAVYDALARGRKTPVH